MMPDEGLCKNSHQDSPSKNTLRRFYPKCECIEKACHTQVLPQRPTLENICDAWMCPTLWRNPLIRMSMITFYRYRVHDIINCHGRNTALAQFPKLHSMVNWPLMRPLMRHDIMAGSLWWRQAPHLKARTQMEERKDHWPMIFYVGTPPTRLPGLKVPRISNRTTLLIKPLTHVISLNKTCRKNFKSWQTKWTSSIHYMSEKINICIFCTWLHPSIHEE